MKSTFKEWGKTAFEATTIIIGLYLLGVSFGTQAGITLILVGVFHFIRDCMKMAEEE